MLFRWGIAQSRVACRELYNNSEFVRYSVAVRSTPGINGFWVYINKKKLSLMMLYVQDKNKDFQAANTLHLEDIIVQYI